jgi:O-antigen ligase
MAMPLALGYAVSVAAGSLPGVYPDWQSRVLWLSSRTAARAILAALAAFGMGIALVMSMSRSGMLACAVAIVGAAWCVPDRPRAWRGRLAPVAASLVLLGGLSVWVGTDVIAQRFADGTDATMMGRFGAWKDTMRIIGDFPIVGTGVNAFSTAMVVYQRSDPNNFWEEAHNDYLQIAAEGGLILSVLVLLAIVAIVLDIRARFREDGASPARWLRAGAVTGLAAIALQEVVEFSLQIPGNAALFVALIAIARHCPPARDRV